MRDLNLRKPIPQVSGSNPIKVDIMEAMYEKNMDPERLATLIGKNDQLVLHAPETYISRYLPDVNLADPGTLGEREMAELERLNNYYKYANEMTSVFRDANEFLPDNPLENIDLRTKLGHPERSMSYIPAIEMANDIIRFGPEQTAQYSEPEEATMRSGYMERVNGKDVWQKVPVKGDVRRKNDFRIDYGQLPSGEEGYFWRKVDGGDEMYGSQMANAWGDPKRYGNNILSAIPAFVTGATVDFAKSAATIAKTVTDLATLYDDGPENAVDKFYNKLINTLEKYSYHPSKEIEENGFAGSIGSLFYNIGKGLGQLVPQAALGFGAGSLAMKAGSKAAAGAAMAASSTVGTMQAVAGQYEAAREAGIDPKDAAGLALFNAPWVYLTERLLAAPYLTKAFQADPTLASLRQVTKKVAESNVRKGIDLSTDQGKLLTAKAISKEFFKDKNVIETIKKLKQYSNDRLLAGKGLDGIPFISGAVREASQESLEELAYMGIEMAYDEYKNAVDPNAEIGDGLFGTKLFSKEGMDRLKESALGGFLIGGIYDFTMNRGKTASMAENIDKQLISGKGSIEENKRDLLLKAARSRDNSSTFGVAGLSASGNNLIGDDMQAPDGDVTVTVQEGDNLEDYGYKAGDVLRSQKDVNFYNFAKQVESQGQFIQESGLSDLSMLKQLRGEKEKEHGEQQFVQAIELSKKSQGIQNQLDDLNANYQQKGPTSPEAEKLKTDIDKTKEQLIAVQQDIKDRVVPEEGSLFSKNINDYVKIVQAASSYAKTETEVAIKDNPNLEKKREEVYFQKLKEYGDKRYNLGKAKETITLLNDYLSKRNEANKQAVEQSKVNAPVWEQAAKDIKRISSKLESVSDQDLSGTLDELSLLVNNLNEAKILPTEIYKEQWSLSEEDRAEIVARIEQERDAALAESDNEEEKKAIQTYYDDQIQTTKNKQSTPVEVSYRNLIGLNLESLIKSFAARIGGDNQEATQVIEKHLLSDGKFDKEVGYRKFTDDEDSGLSIDEYNILDPIENELIQSSEDKSSASILDKAKNIWKAYIDTEQLQLADVSEELKDVKLRNDFKVLTDEEVLRESYLADLKEKIAQLEGFADNNFVGLETIDNEITDVSRSITDRLELARVNNEVLEKYLNQNPDPNVRAHLNNEDVPLPTALYTGNDEKPGIKEELEALHNRLVNVKSAFNETVQSAENKAAGMSLRHVENMRLVFQHAVNKLGITDPTVREALATMPVMSDQERGSKVIANDEYRKRLTDSMEKLYLVQKYFYDNQDRLLGDKENRSKVYSNIIDDFMRTEGNQVPFHLVKDYDRNTTDAINVMDEQINSQTIADGTVYDSNYLVKFLSNVFETSFAVDPATRNKVQQEINEEDGKALSTERSISTFEQTLAEDQAVSVILKQEATDYDTFTKALNPYQEARDSEVIKTGKITKDDLTSKRFDVYNPRGIYFRGDYGTGKSTQGLRNIARKVQAHKGEPIRIKVVAPNEELFSTYEGVLGDLGDKGISYEIMLAKDAFKSNQKIDEGFDFVFWDEGQLLDEKDVNEVFEKTTTPVIFAGDVAQMTKLDRKLGFSVLAKVGMPTTPMSLQFSNDIPLIQQLAYNYKRRIFDSNVEMRFPKVSERIKNGKKQGARYFAKSADVLDAFINSTEDDKALILLDYDHLNRFVSEGTPQSKAILNNEKLRNKVYILESDVRGELADVKIPGTNNTISPKSIQGLRRNEVYIGFDIETARDISNKIEESNKSMISRIGYTAVGRARNFVGLVAPNVAATNNVEEGQVPWGAEKSVQGVRNNETTTYKAFESLFKRVNSTKNVQPVPESTEEQEATGEALKPKKGVLPSGVNAKPIESFSALNFSKRGSGVAPAQVYYVEEGYQEGKFVVFLNKSKEKAGDTTTPDIRGEGEDAYVIGQEVRFEDNKWKKVPGQGKAVYLNNGIHEYKKVIVGKTTVDTSKDEVLPYSGIKNKSGIMINTTDLYNVDGKNMLVDHFVKNGGTNYIIWEDGSRTSLDSYQPVVASSRTEVFVEEPSTDESETVVNKGQWLEQLYESGHQALASKSFWVHPEVTDQSVQENIRAIKLLAADHYKAMEYTLEYNAEKDQLWAVLTDDSETFLRGKLSRLTKTNATEKRALNALSDPDSQESKYLKYFAYVGDRNAGLDQQNITELYRIGRENAKDGVYSFGNTKVSVIAATPGALAKPAQKKYQTFEAFRNDMAEKSSSFVISNNARRTMVNNKPAITVSYKTGTSEGKLFVRTRPLSEYSKASVDGLLFGQDRIVDDIKSLQDHSVNSFETFQKAVNRTFFIQALKSTGKEITKPGNSVNKALRGLGINPIADGVLFFTFGEKGQSWTTERDVFIRALKDLSDNWDSHGAITNNVYSPYRIDDFATGSIDLEATAPLYVDYNDIHSPTLMVEANDVLAYEGIGQPKDQGRINQAISEQKTKTDFETKRKNTYRGRGIPPTEAMTKNGRYDIADQRVNREEAVRVIDHILGRDGAYSLEFVKGLDALRSGDEVLFGMREGLNISLEDAGGVQKYSPRHEAHHVIFWYALTPQARDMLVEELRYRNNDPSLDIYQTAEILADEYSRNFSDKIPEQHPWWTPSGLLMRFKTFLDRLMVRWGLYKPTIDKLIDDAENGVFRGFRPRPDGNAPSIEFMTKDYEQDAEAFDLDNPNLFSAIKEIEKHFDLVELPKLVSIFGYKLDISSPFPTADPDFRSTSIPEMIRKGYEGFKASVPDPNRKATINDRRVPWSEINKSNYMSLSEKDNLAYTDYFIDKLSNEETYKAFVSLLFPDYKYKPGKMQKWSKEIYDERTKENPNAVRSGILKWQYNITPLHKYDFNGNRINRNWDETSFVSDQSLTAYLGDAMHEAMATLRTEGNYFDNHVSEKDLVNALIKALRDKANTFTTVSETRDTISSFINHWLQSDTMEESKYEMLERLRTDKTRRRDRDVKMLEDLFHTFLSDTYNLRRRNQTDTKIVRSKNGSFRIIAVDRANGRFKDNAEGIHTTVRHQLFEQEGMTINKFKMDQFEDPTLSDKQNFDRPWRIVSEGSNAGLYYTKGYGKSEGIPFIKIKKIKTTAEGAQYSYSFENKSPQLIEQLRRLLGFTHVSNEIFMTLLQTKQSPRLKEFFRGTGTVSFHDTNQIEGILASSLFNMTLALQSYGKLQNSILEKAGENELTSDQERAIRQEEHEKAWNTTEGKILNDYMQRSYQKSMIDLLEDEFSDEDAVAETENFNSYPTPLDFKGFFNLLGAVQAYHMGDDYSSSTSDFSGKKRFNYVKPSSLFSQFGNGSHKFSDYYTGIMTPENAAKSPFAIIEGNKVRILNQFAKPDGMRIHSMKEHTSIKYLRATSKPSTTDMIVMSLGDFVKGLRENSEYLNIPIITLGESGKIITLKTSLKGTFDERLLGKVNYDKETGHLSVDPKTLNNNWINQAVKDNFDKAYKNYSLSADRIISFVQSLSEGSRMISDLKKAKKDPTKFSEEFNKVMKIYAKDLKDDYKQVLWAANRDLQGVVDFKIEDGIIQAGNSASMNDNIYNYNNYQKYKDSKYSTEARKEIFAFQLQDLSRKMISYDVFKITDELRGMMSDNLSEMFYRTEVYEEEYEGQTYQTKEKFYNPILEAFFYAYHIVNNSFNDFTIGQWDNFPDLETQSKYADPVATPGNSIIPNVAGVGTRIRIIMLDTKVGHSPRSIYNSSEKNRYKVADGRGIGNPIVAKLFMDNLGDEIGQFDWTMQKTTTNHIDPVTGRRTQIKQAIDVISSGSYNLSLEYRHLLKMMLDETTKLMNEMHDDYDLDLHERFQELMRDGRTFDEAVDDLVWEIKDHRYSDDIRNNLIWQAADQTTMKGNTHSINHYESMATGADQIKSFDIDVSSIRFILNAYHDPEDIEGSISRFNQILGLLPLMNNAKSKPLVNRAYEIMGELFDKGKGQMQREMAQISIPDGLPKNKESAYRMQEYLRRKSIELFSSGDFSGNYGKIIANESNTMDFPGISHNAIYSLRNFINDIAINGKFNGMRVVLSEGDSMLIFVDPEGEELSLRDIEREHGMIELSDLVADKQTDDDIAVNGKTYTFTKDGITYKAHRPLPSGPEYDSSQAFLPFGNMAMYGIEAGETLNQAFTVYLKEPLDGKTQINLKRKTQDERGEILSQLIEKDLIDKDRTIAFRKVSKKPELLNYYNALFEQTQMLLGSRTPAHKLGSASHYSMIDFVEDTGNTGYFATEQVAVTDEDYDIDNKAIYLKMFNNRFTQPEKGRNALQNELLDIMRELYSDKDNKKMIYFSSAIDELKEKAKSITEGQGRSAGNMFGTQITQFNNNQTGTNSISIHAVNNTVVGNLIHMGPKLKEVFPEIYSMLQKKKSGKEHFLSRIGDLLQAALDNPKFNILSPLGISYDASGVATAMILSDYSWDDMIAFLRDPFVKGVFRKISARRNITSKPSEHDQFLVLDQFRSAAIEAVAEFKRDNPDYAKLSVSKIKEEIASLEETAKTDDNAKEWMGMLKDYSNDLKNVQLAEKLYKFMLMSERLRRVGQVVGLRNGVKVLEYDHYQFNHYMALNLGRSTYDYILNPDRTVPFQERMKYWRENEDKYLELDVESIDQRVARLKQGNQTVPLSKEEQERKDEANRLLTIEKHIQKDPFTGKEFNLNAVVSAFPNFKKYLHEQFFDTVRYKDVMLRYSDWANSTLDTMLRMNNQTHLHYRRQMVEWQKKLENLTLAAYWKQQGMVELKTNEYSALDRIDLSKASGQQIFRKRFPEYFQFIKDASETYTKAEGIKMLSDAGLDPNILDSLRNNQFLKMLRVTGNPGSEVVQFGDYAGFRTSELDMLTVEFKKLPEFLRKLLRVNQVLNTGLWGSKGSIVDVMGTEFHDDFSKTVRMVNAFLNDKGNAMFLGVEKNDITAMFMDWAAANPDISPYLSKKDEAYKDPYTFTQYVKREYFTLRQTFMRTLIDKALSKAPFDATFDKSFSWEPKDKGNQNITFVTKIRNLTPKELSDVELMYDGVINKFNKSYILPHTYKEGQVLLTSSGKYIEVKSQTKHNVVFVKPNDISKLQEAIREQQARKLKAIRDQVENVRQQVEEGTQKRYAYKSVEVIQDGEKKLVDNLVEEPKEDVYGQTIQDKPIKKKSDMRELSPIDQFSEKQKQRVDGKAFSALVDYLYKQQGIRFTPAIDMFDENGRRVIAQIGENGISYDEELVYGYSPIHELGHLWLHAAEKYNKSLFDTLMGQVEHHRDSSAYRAVSGSYPTLNQRDLDFEYLSTMIGLNGEKEVQAWMSRYDIYTKNDAEGLWGKIKNWFNLLLDGIRSLFPTYTSQALQRGATLNDLTRAMAHDMLTGRMVFSKQQLSDTLMSAYGQRVDNSLEGVSDSNGFMKKTPIRKLIDLVNYLNNGTDVDNDASALIRETFADYVVSRMYPIDNGSKMAFKILNKTFEIDVRQETKESLKEKVIANVVNPILDRQDKIKSDLADFIRLAGVDREAAVKKANQLFKNEEGQEFDPIVYDKILKIAEVDGGVVDVVRYSELKDHHNPVLRRLYNDKFEGFDPLVIIHQVEKGTGKIHLSMLDPTITSLGFDSEGITGKGLTAAFESDLRYVKNGGTMNNSMGDIRRLFLGMQLMAMAKGTDVAVRNMGVVQLIRNDLNAKMVPDVNVLFQHVALLTNNEDMQRVMDQDSDFSKIISDENLQNYNYIQSWVDRLHHYWESNDGTPKLNRNEYVGKPAMRTMMARRMNELQKRIENNQKEYLYEYHLLGRALMQAERRIHNTGWVNNIDDMSMLDFRWVTTHNVKSDILQYMMDRLDAAKDITVHRVSEFQERMAPYVEEVIKHYESINTLEKVGEKAAKFVREAGNLYFKKLYRTATVNGVDVTLPEIIWDRNSVEARGLSEAELTFANKLLDELESLAIDLQFHQKQQFDTKITLDKVKEDFYKGYRRGVVPSINQSVSAMMAKFNVKGAGRLMAMKFLNTEALLTEDMINRGFDVGIEKSRAGKTRLLSSFLIDQLNPLKAYEAAGLRMKDGRLEVVEPERNKSMSTNLQNIGNYTYLQGIRKMVYETEFLPDYNAVKSIFAITEMMGKSQEYNRKWADEVMSRVVYQRNADFGTPENPKPQLNPRVLSFAGMPVTLASMTRAAQQAMTFSVLAFNPVVWGKSFAFNEIAGLIHSTAVSVSNGMRKKYGQQANELFGVKEYLKAHGIVKGKGYQKAMAISQMLQIVNRTERDLLELPALNKTDMNIFQDKMAHWGNWFTDNYARMITMTAQMLKEGSWDAYEFNPETGKITYNERKDRRFFNEQGGFKSKVDEALYNDLKERLSRQGRTIKDALPVGHDYTLANNIKWISDKFVIGSMDPLRKSLASNFYLTAMASQFRLFSFDKLQNAGLGIGTRKTTAGAGFKAVFDEESGTYIVERELQEIEGAWQSIAVAYRDVLRGHKMSAGEWFAMQGTVRQINMIRSAMNVLTAAVLAGIIYGIVDKDDQKKFSWMLNDIVPTLMLGEVVKSPIPVISAAKNLFDIAFGRKNAKAIFRYIPGNRFISIPQRIAEMTWTEEQEMLKAIEETKRKAEKKALEEVKKGKTDDTAAQGLSFGGTVGEWEIIEDLAGMPSHKEGGVDLSVENGQVFFSSDNVRYRANKGLFIHKAQDGLFIKGKGQEEFVKDNTVLPRDNTNLAKEKFPAVPTASFDDDNFNFHENVKANSFGIDKQIDETISTLELREKSIKSIDSLHDKILEAKANISPRAFKGFRDENEQLIPVGDDIAYPVSGYMRNSKLDSWTKDAVYKHAVRDGLDPNVLLSALMIENQGLAVKNTYYNTHDYINKRMHKLGIPNFRKPSYGDEYWYDYIAADIGYANRRGEFIEGSLDDPLTNKVFEYGDYNDKKVFSTINDKIAPKVNDLIKEIDSIEDYVDLHSRFIKEFGLEAVNPKQKDSKTYLGVVKHKYEDMVNAGAEIIRAKKIFD